MSGSYRVAPLFVIRLAGAPFDRLEALATARSSALARQFIALEDKLRIARDEAATLVGSRESGLDAEQSRAVRSVIRGSFAEPGVENLPVAAQVVLRLRAEVEQLAGELESTAEEELGAARRALSEASRAVLPDYLVFAGREIGQRASDLLALDPNQLPTRNARTRERERHLFLYLQRVAAKNDTYSAFGPSAWGTIEAAEPRLQFESSGAVARRDVFFERWAAHLAAAAINADPDAEPELRPRVNPNGFIADDGFFLADTNMVVPLDETSRQLLARIDGETPLSSLFAAASPQEAESVASLVAQLVAQRVLLLRMEVAPVDPHAFDALVAEVVRWSDGPARARWLATLEPLAQLPKRFARATNAPARVEIMNDARARLEPLGAVQSLPQRSLYSATNPIAEECVRDCRFVLSEAMAAELASDAAPWFDLWRDCYAFVASRVAAGLRTLLETAPRHKGVVTLPAFLAHCAAQKMPLTGHGIVALAHIAFQEVKAAFRETIASRAAADEVEFTSSDAQLVRRRFEFPAFDQYTFPTADVQISAGSVDDVNRGRYNWVVSELHPPIALLQHAVLWGCPDMDSLGDALRSTTFGQPTFHYGFFAADFTAHTTVRQMEVPRDGMVFVTAERPRPEWPSVPPASVEVAIDESGDVGLCERGSGRYLGSFARGWVIPLGFHPFFFDRPPHMPRLRCGKVIVQRQSWTVGAAELKPADTPRGRIVAVEELRAARNLPRFVYVRPTEQALRRSGVVGRDKDTKPVFIDLESYLSIEVLQRWLAKGGELEVTEMLPDPEHLFWREGDGRHTVELRMQIVPR